MRDKAGGESERDGRLPMGEDGPEALHDRSRRVPFLRFFAYYVALLAVAVGLAVLFPPIREALIAPEVLRQPPSDVGLLTGEEPANRPIVEPDGGLLFRGLTTMIVVLGSLALALPVAWVYIFTRRLRYDPSLVHSIIILPIAVAGIVIVVKNSLALAFSLAGIVAAVRFRNTLKDPKDAVYIFLTIGIGLSAGVQALDVSLVISLAFNIVVLVLWKYNLGAIYSGASASPGTLGIGDPTLHRASTPEARMQLCETVAEEAESMKTDGILLIHALDMEAARRGVEVSLSGKAKEWRVVATTAGGDGAGLLQVLVRLKKKSDPVKLLGEIEDRWGAYIAAAEYVPYTTQQNES